MNDQPATNARPSKYGIDIHKEIKEWADELIDKFLPDDRGNEYVHNNIEAFLYQSYSTGYQIGKLDAERGK